MSEKFIPTEEDLARASAALKQRSRGLSQIRDNILCQYAKRYKLHEFFILDSKDTSFRVYVFFEKEKDAKKAINSGTVEKIKCLVYNELDLAGRGPRENIEVFFEFDSHEMVERNYEGDYYNRLR